MMRRVLMVIGAMLWVGVVAVHAHENRQVGGYTVTVGFRAEPAFEDVVNAVDIFINALQLRARPTNLPRKARDRLSQ
jgi:hypothetical protein